MKFGALRHDFLIGKRYGSQISATAGYIYALCPTPALWTRALARRTQILYTPDISTILLLLDARPGSVICETGTGSGSLSHALAVAIAPTGHLYTHDIDETRVRQVERELKDHGLDSCTTVVLQDTCEDGFFVENACDGVFLDLPAPWMAIPHAKRALSRVRGGRIVSFSPCIEQVQRACIELEKQGFIKIETIEVVPRNLKAITHVTESLESINSKAGAMEPGITNPRAKKRRLDESNGMDSISAAIPFPAVQPTHTGYLTSATLLPSLEEPNFEPL
uniref:tRNA (adenine(58)-N(1))-methyltransferase catalytic subunit TRMT61A n=1 Tax=Acrobeloides nanus TaxID=290746 RepID=A0A914CY02_9BILA